MLVGIGKILFHDEEIDEMREWDAYNTIEDDCADSVTSSKDFPGDHNPIPIRESLCSIREDERYNKNDGKCLAQPYFIGFWCEDDFKIEDKDYAKDVDQWNHSEIWNLAWLTNRTRDDVDGDVIN